MNKALLLGAAYGKHDSSFLLMSTDSGATWTATPSAVYDPTPLGNGEAILDVSQYRIQRSVDGGVTWQSVGPTLSGNYGEGFVADPVRPSYAWFCLMDSGTSAMNWVTSDAGATWHRQRRIDICRPQVVEPGGNHVLLATDEYSPTEAFIYRSIDSGAKWKRVRIAHEVPSGQPAFSEARPQVAVLAAFQLDQAGNVTFMWSIWRTTDAGLHWRKVWTVPTGRCGGCPRYSAPFGGAQQPVFGDNRFVLGPITPGSSDTSRGARYLIGDSRGLHWRMIAAPYASLRKPADVLPWTGSAVATGNGLVAPNRRNLLKFWRLRPSASAWTEEPFLISGG